MILCAMLAVVIPQNEQRDIEQKSPKKHSGSYVINKTKNGKFNYTLFDRRAKLLASSAIEFDSPEEAKVAVRLCQKAADGANFEDDTLNLIRDEELPKFVVDSANGAYLFMFVSGDGKIMLKSDSFAKHDDCVLIAKKALYSATTLDVYLSFKMEYEKTAPTICEKQEPSKEVEPKEDDATVCPAVEIAVTEYTEETVENVACEEEIENDEDDDEENSVVEENGFMVTTKIRKAFVARMILANDAVKENYNILKNAILSFKNVKSRISWDCDTFNTGRIKLAKIVARSRMLKLYLALSPEDVVDEKYKTEQTTYKKYQTVPCVCIIRNPHNLKMALELIEVLANKFELKSGEEMNEDFVPPFETKESLMEKKLIKKIIVKKAIF